MEKLVLPHALGNAAATWYFFALRIGHAQDEHVLGQPTLFAAHAGGDAQGQAFFAQQCIATVS